MMMFITIIAKFLMLLHSLRHALPYALDRAVLHFAVEVYARAVQDSEPLVPRLLAAVRLQLIFGVLRTSNSLLGFIHERV